MSVINTNQFATGFAPTSSTLAEFENASGSGPGEVATGVAQPADNIALGTFGPPTMPIASPVFAMPGAPASAGASNGGYDFNSILNEIGNLISGLFQQLGSMLGGSTAPGTGSPPPLPGTGSPETYFANATSSSTGDPHLAFDGTTGAGATVSDKWNSMTSHANLLSSDSFSGGYRVSTQATAANSEGITHNASATVATDCGATDVTMEANGSYDVTENGHNVSLTQGQATSLGNGETVTLNSDGSLTVADTNAAGGSLSTTLKTDGSGVNVTNTAHDVDLGGYLVHKTDSDVDPVANGGAQTGYPPVSPPAAAAAGYSGASPYAYGAMPSPEQQMYAAQPMVTGLEQFDPDQTATSLQNIDLG